MDVIFLLMESPPDLLVAVRIGNPNYSSAYTLMNIEYAQTEMDRIERSAEFEELPIEAVDPLLEDVYEWSRRDTNHRSHVRRVLVHKKTGGSFD
jgi:hypothetical protein